MRSPMIENLEVDDKHKYSDLKVMKSAAGYYIGTTFTNAEDDEFPGLVEPGSRDSDYYATEEAAQEALDTMNWCQRWTP